MFGLLRTEMSTVAGHKRTIVATEHAYAADLRLHLKDAADRQQDFIMAPLFAPTTPARPSDWNGRNDHHVRRQVAANTPGTALSNSQWMSDVVASHADASAAYDSPSGAKCAAENGHGGQSSNGSVECPWLDGLEEEIEWASYVGVQAYVGPPCATPAAKGRLGLTAGARAGDRDLPLYAQTVRTSLDRLAGYLQFWLTVPLVPLVNAECGSAAESESEPASAALAVAGHSGKDTFMHWDAFRALTDYHPRVGVAVLLPEGRSADSKTPCSGFGLDAHWVPPPGRRNVLLVTPYSLTLFTLCTRPFLPSETVDRIGI